MRLRLAYGQQGLFVTLPAAHTTVIEPLFNRGLSNEAESLHQALAAPLGTAPLQDMVSSQDSIVIVIPDITRAMPSSRVLPILLQHLAHVPPAQITILIATGTHRPATRSELCRMLGGSIIERYRIENHLGYDANQHIDVGCTPSGIPVKLNRIYVQATKRIVCGFIEPHFFAGFSGGPKMVCPGVAAAETIFHLHSAPLIANPHATWGVVDGNPIQEEIRHAANLLPPDFCLSVALNKFHQITAIFAGDLYETQAHGIEYVRYSAMRAVTRQFDIVVSTNSGYPLDLNLYQTVKGMSAAAQIVRPGGSIIMASECRDGVPPGSSYDKLLRSRSTPEELLQLIATPGFFQPEQWQAQIHAQILLRASTYLYSDYLDARTIRSAYLHPCTSIESQVDELFTLYGPDAQIAVLPEGPQTIAYLCES